ncbi:hypothetical protein [Actinoplanes sp. NPDC049316]|uniref:hypothetical protein n=1 Tax=Actinoplanes sp. NPDC049316 TaxID=3154727 RepID=UPI0034487BE5
MTTPLPGDWYPGPAPLPRSEPVGAAPVSRSEASASAPVVRGGYPVLAFGDDALVAVAVPGAGARLSVRRDVAPLLVALAAAFHREVQPLDPLSCWGHCHASATRGWNGHAAGIAVDLNAAAHPPGACGTFRPEQVPAVRGLITRWKYRGRPVLTWGGGDHHGGAAESHFEIAVPYPVALAVAAGLAT